jgi:hypothetical protein
MHLLHRGVGIALFHPMVEDGFQVSGRNVPNDFLPDERIDLVVCGTFQPAISGPLHRWEFENLQPMNHAILNRLLRFIRLANFFVELGNVICDLLLSFRFCFAGKHFPFFLPVFVKVPNHALPAAIDSLKYIAVGCHSFFGMVVPPLGLFYQPPTLPYCVCLCPAQCFNPGREKIPHLLGDLRHP